MLPWKLQQCQFLPVNQNLSSVHFSLAKFHLVSCILSLVMIWQMTYAHKLPKVCSATLIENEQKYFWRVKHDDTVALIRAPKMGGFLTYKRYSTVLCSSK